MSLLASFILTFLCVVGYCAQEHRSNISIMTMGREIEPGSGNSDNNVSPSSEIENVTSTKIDQYDSLTKRIKSLMEQKEIEREKVKSCSPMPFVNICDMASLITKKAREEATDVPNDSQCQTTCRPGKKGPEGAKGDIGSPGQNGATGRQGAKGESGTPCNCSRYDELAHKVQILEKARELELLADGWYRVHSYPYWYKLANVSSDYQTARKNCELMGGRLAAKGIRNPTIRSDLLDKFIRRTGTPIWIGLDDIEEQDNWKWSDGVLSTTSNTPWGSTEPNNPTERCACMHDYWEYQIADLGCNYKQFYLCEK
uniref:collectin-11-like isoform X2 n=1 Tax=Styela clava TaxID=7725 RepID=UPI00193AD301|nr:collectin-11-like isoform X2 [Styela clava]